MKIRILICSFALSLCIITNTNAEVYTNDTYGFSYTYDNSLVNSTHNEYAGAFDGEDIIYIGDHGLILNIGDESIYPRAEHCTLADPDYIDGLIDEPESEAVCFGNEKFAKRSVEGCRKKRITGHFFKEYYICSDMMYAFRACDDRAKQYEVYYNFSKAPKNTVFFENILKSFRLTTPVDYKP